MCFFYNFHSFIYICTKRNDLSLNSQLYPSPCPLFSYVPSSAYWENPYYMLRNNNRHSGGLSLYVLPWYVHHNHFFDVTMVEHWGQLYFILPSTLISTRSSSVPPSFLTSDGVGGVGDGWTFIWGGGVPGGGVGVVIPLSNHSNCGRSLSLAVLTVSSNMPHPSTIILCPVATVRTAEVHKNIFV